MSDKQHDSAWDTGFGGLRWVILASVLVVAGYATVLIIRCVIRAGAER